MDERGADRDKIYESTGWFKGKDGKWRFEIPDNFNKIDLGKLLKNSKAQLPLDDIYDNPALFAAYPNLRKVLVTTEVLSPDINGETDGKKKITLNWFNTKFLPEESAKTLVHELQHIIQDYEKFASGGDPQTIEMDLDDNANKIIYEADKIKAPYSKEYFDSILDVKKAIKRGNAQAEAKARKEMAQARQALSPKEREKIETLAERYYEIKNTKTKSNKAKVDAYWRLGGEQESRYVEERLFDRTGNPKAHDPDALIIYGGRTYPVSRQSFRNKKNASENGNGELAHGSITPSAATANGTTTNAVTNVTAGTNDKGGVSSTADVETNSPSKSISQEIRGGKIKYSINANDNGEDSLIRKARNKLASLLNNTRQLNVIKSRLPPTFRKSASIA